MKKYFRVTSKVFYGQFEFYVLYVIDENCRQEFENEYKLCRNLKRIGLEIKNIKMNKGLFLIDQLKILNNEFFQSGKHSCHLPCQFSFITNGVDIKSCYAFNSLTSPVSMNLLSLLVVIVPVINV